MCIIHTRVNSAPPPHTHPHRSSTTANVSVETITKAHTHTHTHTHIHTKPDISTLITGVGMHTVCIYKPHQKAHTCNVMNCYAIYADTISLALVQVVMFIMES